VVSEAEDEEVESFAKALEIAQELGVDMLGRKGHAVPIDGLEEPDVILDILYLVGIVELGMLAIYAGFQDLFEIHALGGGFSHDVLLVVDIVIY
jgi:hypothetical protein